MKSSNNTKPEYKPQASEVKKFIAQYYRRIAIIRTLSFISVFLLGAITVLLAVRYVVESETALLLRSVNATDTALQTTRECMELLNN